jgi:hypothetical protein
MVITILSAIGIFAMRSASLVDVATGYNRQGVQAGLLAEYAARATATYMTRGEDFIAKAAEDAVGGCADAYFNANGNASCTVIHDANLRDDFSAGTDDLSGKLALNNGPIGVRGLVASEVLVPSAAASLSRPGFEGAHFKQLTVTAVAHIFPANNTTMATSCSAGAREALSQQSVRAHVIVPQF